jgi:hypothetical protein
MNFHFPNIFRIQAPGHFLAEGWRVCLSSSGVVPCLEIELIYG